MLNCEMATMGKRVDKKRGNAGGSRVSGQWADEGGLRGEEQGRGWRDVMCSAPRRRRKRMKKMYRMLCD